MEKLKESRCVEMKQVMIVACQQGFYAFLFGLLCILAIPVERLDTVSIYVWFVTEMSFVFVAFMLRAYEVRQKLPLFYNYVPNWNGNSFVTSGFMLGVSTVFSIGTPTYRVVGLCLGILCIIMYSLIYAKILEILEREK